jgi:putative PIN family toxin of toxin-antitoxin system
LRIAFDSAILVRANQRATGPARALLLEVLDRGHTLVLSSSALDEAGRVLRYSRLAKRYALTGAEIAGFIAFLSASANLVEPDETVAPPIRDPDDIHVIQMAVAGQADYLCTLDAHFMTPRCLPSVCPKASES